MEQNTAYGKDPNLRDLSCNIHRALTLDIFALLTLAVLSIHRLTFSHSESTNSLHTNKARWCLSLH